MWGSFAPSFAKSIRGVHLKEFPKFRGGEIFIYFVDFGWYGVSPACFSVDLLRNFFVDFFSSEIARDDVFVDSVPAG